MLHLLKSIWSNHKTGQILLFVTHNLGIGKQWSSVKLITTLSITVTSYNKPVKQEVEMGLAHTVQNLFVTRKPTKSLLSSHCIGKRMLSFEKISVIQSFTTFPGMITNVQFINTTVKFLPHITVGRWQVKRILQQA